MKLNLWIQSSSDSNIYCISVHSTTKYPLKINHLSNLEKWFFYNSSAQRNSRCCIQKCSSKLSLDSVASFNMVSYDDILLSYSFTRSTVRCTPVTLYIALCMYTVSLSHGYKHHTCTLHFLTVYAHTHAHVRMHTHAHTHTMQHTLQRLIASCQSLLLNIWQPSKASISQTLITEGSSCEWAFWASNMLVRCSNRNPKYTHIWTLGVRVWLDE